MMDKAELEKMREDMARVVKINEGLEREIKATRREANDAAAVATSAKREVERLEKLRPSDKIETDNKGLRNAVSESHKKIAVLEKELVAAKAESEGRRKEISQLQQRLSNVQNTFEMMQGARDKAYVDRDKALVDLQGAANAYHKLQEEFNAFKKEIADKEAEKKPGKGAPKPEPAKA